jgi:hypothetical protein
MFIFIVDYDAAAAETVTVLWLAQKLFPFFKQKLGYVAWFKLTTQCFIAVRLRSWLAAPGDRPAVR